MPLTAAERARRFKEKLKQDPNKYDEYRKKQVERVKKCQKQIKDLSDQEKEMKRRQWRNQKAAQKKKKIAPTITENDEFYVSNYGSCAASSLQEATTSANEIKMPLTPAERAKRFRDKLKQDPSKYEEYRQKQIERVRKCQKHIRDLNDEEKTMKRIQWRNQKAAQKQRKMELKPTTEKESTELNTTKLSSTPTNIQTHNYDDKKNTGNVKDFEYVEIKQEHENICTQDDEECNSELINTSEDIVVKIEYDGLNQDHWP